jgi:DNA-binding NtrC family response regulator
VKVYLPRAEGTPAAPASKPQGRRPGGSETILVVEDEELVRGVATASLRKYGYTVIEASSAEEALEIAGKYDGAIHLVLTDVVMPHMSGRQLAERLAQSRPETRVIYTSGYTDNAIVHQGVLDPGVAFIQKPYTLDILLQMVRRVLDGQLPHGGAASLDTSGAM